jgi:hypothetical protein
MSKFICAALIMTAAVLAIVRLREAILDYAEDEIDWEGQ